MNGTTFAVKAFAGMLTIAAAALFAPPSPAHAQQIVARVNGAPITSIDLAQRSRLLQLSAGGKPVARQTALDELIEQEIKLQTAQRYRIDIGELEVNQTLASMAGRVGVDVPAFSRQLETAGVSVSQLKRKIKADISWQHIVRGKFQASLQVRERDVQDAARAKGDSQSFKFTLRPIMFIVPSGSGPAVYESRRREAELLRNRFQNCDEGLRLARGMRDTVVREPLVRNSGDVSGKQRELLESTPVGRLTPPDVTQAGVEVFAVCAKDAAKGAAGAERDIREQMVGELISTHGKAYLRQLRRSASIQLQ